jgi:hypothetical protein
VLSTRVIGQQGRGDEQIGTGPVAGDRDIPYHRDPHQGLDVGIVRLRVHGIGEEHQQVQVARRDQRADLLVAAERAALQAGDLQAELIGQQPAGRTGGHQDAAAQQLAVVIRPFAQVLCSACRRPDPGPASPASAGPAGLGTHRPR